MENLIFFLYDLHLIKVMNIILILATIFMGALLVAYIIWSTTEYSDCEWPFLNNGEHSKPFKTYMKVFATVIILNILIPTHETFAMLYIIPKISDNAFIKEQMPELFNLTIEHFKDELRESAGVGTHK